MSKSKTDAYEYVQLQESTDTSFVQVGSNSKKIVVTFAGNMHHGFERKSSLLTLQEDRGDFDILYLRNKDKWYLGKLKGIGTNINHSLSFFKKKLKKYDKIIFTGSSAGAYASMLFGSLLQVDCVIASRGQTDLEYVLENLWYPPLLRRKKSCSKTWQKYNRLVDIISEKVNYFVFYEGNTVIGNNHRDLILHGDYHYDLIKNFNNVKKLTSKNEVMEIINQELK